MFGSKPPQTDASTLCAPQELNMNVDGGYRVDGMEIAAVTAHTNAGYAADETDAIVASE